MSKEGVYRVLGEILSASPSTIKKDINRVVIEIRAGEKLFTKRINQLRNIKAIFCQSKLGFKASEIDRLIETLERPKAKSNNGVEFKYQE